MDLAGYERIEIEDLSWKVRLSQAAARVRSDISFAVIDAILVAIAYSAALIVRFVDVRGVPEDWLQPFALALPIVVLVHVLANLAFGAYGHVWEFASVEEAMRLVFAAAASSVFIVLGAVLYRQATGDPGPMPLTVILAGALIALGGMGALRFRSRLFSFRKVGDVLEPMRTVVLGTGRAAVELARNESTLEPRRAILGFLSLGSEENPRHLAGRAVFGSLGRIAEVVERLQVDEVIVASSLSESELSGLVDACMEIEVRLRIVPDFKDLLKGSAHLNDIRDLKFEDLLPRPTVAQDLTGSTEVLSNRRVLVTGAGGSIGSEMVRQLLDLSAQVTALDNDETLLHDALLSWPDGDVETVLCDIREADDVRRAIDDARPEIIFHAAALKHVPILERFPAQAVKTNVFGTANVLNASREFGVSRFVLISTDKAVNPESVLGATKRIAEMLVQSAASTNNVKYGAVRFGNVLGSRGSVVPTFMEQIRRGGPVTITDREMTRYFMTVPEAIGLVLQTAALAHDGEVFVLDMGEPARIDDLAHRMIRLAGLVPGRDIEVRVTGARPGEKTTETLSVGPMAASLHPKITIAKPGFPGPATMHDILRVLEEEVQSRDAHGLRKLVRDIGRQNWKPNEVVDLTTLEQFAL